jgi:hypothetical protein
VLSIDFFRGFISGYSLVSNPSVYYRATSWPKEKKKERKKGSGAQKQLDG